MFKLERVPATIKPGTAFKDAVTAAHGADAKPKRMTEVELHLEVDVSECPDAVEDLFPGADAYCKTVAGLEKQCKGEDRSARTKLPEMNVLVWYGTEAEPVVDCQACSVKSRVLLKVNEDGDGKIIIKPRVRLDNKQLTGMAQLIKADVRVSMEPAQVDLSDVSIGGAAAAGSASPGKKGKRKSQAQLHAIDGGGGDEVDSATH